MKIYLSLLSVALATPGFIGAQEAPPLIGEVSSRVSAGGVEAKVSESAAANVTASTSYANLSRTEAQVRLLEASQTRLQNIKTELEQRQQSLRSELENRKKAYGKVISEATDPGTRGGNLLVNGYFDRVQAAAAKIKETRTHLADTQVKLGANQENLTQVIAEGTAASKKKDEEKIKFLEDTLAASDLKYGLQVLALRILNEYQQAAVNDLTAKVDITDASAVQKAEDARKAMDARYKSFLKQIDEAIARAESSRIDPKTGTRKEVEVDVERTQNYLAVARDLYTAGLQYRADAADYFVRLNAAESSLQAAKAQLIELDRANAKLENEKAEISLAATTAQNNLAQANLNVAIAQAQLNAWRTAFSSSNSNSPMALIESVDAENAQTAKAVNDSWWSWLWIPNHFATKPDGAELANRVKAVNAQVNQGPNTNAFSSLTQLVEKAQEAQANALRVYMATTNANASRLNAPVAQPTTNTTNAPSAEAVK